MAEQVKTLPPPSPVPEAMLRQVISPEHTARKVIHVDMDAFFASIEQRDHPSWRGRPVIVAGDPDRRGVVSTASYEARRFGIHSAMPAKTAHRLCPQGIFVAGSMKRYQEVSQEIRAIFHRMTDLVEPLSIDEAFLDVTVNHLDEPSATRLAMRLRQEIFAATRLTASAGVSYNKFLAKIASDFHKPDGLTVIPPSRAMAFLASLPIEKFYGVGKVSAGTFRKLGITDGASLYAAPLELLLQHFGKVGHFFYRIVRGIDDRPVDPAESRRSVGRETTFATDCDDPVQLCMVIDRLAAAVALRLAKHHLTGRTVTLKLRYEDFSTITRAVTHPRPVSGAEAIALSAKRALSRTEAGRRKVRLVGVTVSGFPEPAESGFHQVELPLGWDDPELAF